MFPWDPLIFHQVKFHFLVRNSRAFSATDTLNDTFGMNITSDSSNKDDMEERKPISREIPLTFNGNLHINGS